MTHSETDYDGDADDDSMNDGHTSANAAKEPTQKPPEIALKESSTPVVKTPPQSAKMDVNDYLITQQQRATAAKIKEQRQTTVRDFFRGTPQPSTSVSTKKETFLRRIDNQANVHCSLKIHRIIQREQKLAKPMLLMQWKVIFLHFIQHFFTIHNHSIDSNLLNDILILKFI